MFVVAQAVNDTCDGGADFVYGPFLTEQQANEFIENNKELTRGHFLRVHELGYGIKYPE